MSVPGGAGPAASRRCRHRELPDAAVGQAVGVVPALHAGAGHARGGEGPRRQGERSRGAWDPRPELGQGVPGVLASQGRGFPGCSVSLGQPPAWAQGSLGCCQLGWRIPGVPVSPGRGSLGCRWHPPAWSGHPWNTWGALQPGQGVLGEARVPTNESAGSLGCPRHPPVWVWGLWGPWGTCQPGCGVSGALAAWVRGPWGAFQ